MAAPQGLVDFPGIVNILGASLTRGHGGTPWICQIQMAPQESLVKLNGTLTITFGRVKLTYPNSQVDLTSVEKNRGGMIVSVRIKTRHWKWKYGAIDGLYNDRTNSGVLIKKLEKSPRELAEILVKAMGETNVDLRILESPARPRVDWVAANPANELSRLCDNLGCRLIVNNKNQLAIVRLGDGKPLPDSDVMQEGIGINPADRPDIIRIIGGPDVFQSLLELEAVGIEDDDAGTLVPIDQLSYKPTEGWGKESPQGFWGVAPGKSKDIKERCRQLALKSVYRLYRIKQQVGGGWSFPGGAVEIKDRKQIVLLPSQVVKAPALTEDDPERFKPAKVIGSYYPESWHFRNTDLGTVYDGQFQLDPSPKRQLVEFAKPVYMLVSIPNDIDNPEGDSHTEFGPANLRLETSYNVKDADTRQLIRSQKDRRVSTGPMSSNPLIMPVVQDDIFRSRRATYTALRQELPNVLTGRQELSTVSFNFKKSVTNDEEFDSGCNHYLDAISRGFQDVVTGQRQYAGIRDDIDLDGLCQQITYTVGRSGATTIASINTEHDYDVPSYAERRLRELTRFIPR